MNVAWQSCIESSYNVIRGKPRIKGTRIPVILILGYLANGYASDKIINEFPGLDKDKIAACLDYTRELAEFEVAA